MNEKLLVRAAGSFISITEAMKNAVEIDNNIESLMKLLNDIYGAFMDFTTEDITVEFYANDARIDWETHLVCINGNAMMFVNGKVKGINGE